MEGFEIRKIAAVETLALRQQILRPHQAPEELVYPGDLAPESLHVGAFIAGELVGVGSVLPGPMPDGQPGAASAWQLRGMATRPEFRRRGCGTALLRACIAHVAGRGGGVLWCNARTGALSLYRASGLETRGTEFQIPHAGPHFLMWRKVEPTCR